MCFIFTLLCLVVTYVCGDGFAALRCLVTLCKISDVRDLKAAVAALIARNYEQHSNAARVDHSSGTCNDGLPAAVSIDTNDNISNKDRVTCTESTNSNVNNCLNATSSVNSNDEHGVIGMGRNANSQKCDNLNSSKMEVCSEERRASSDPMDYEDNKPFNSFHKEDKTTNLPCNGGGRAGSHRQCPVSKPPDVNHIVVAEVFDNHVAKILVRSNVSETKIYD